MKKYRKSILAFAIVISPLSSFFMYVGIHKGGGAQVVFWGGTLIVSWGLYMYLLKGSRLSFWLSFAVVNIVWWPLLLQTINRIVFVIENHGMDRPDGGGSPLAFLLGLMGEQMFFIPLTVAMIFGVPVALTVMRQSGTDRAEDRPSPD
jgi:hypothetical protein